jgi:hypothetical protein
MLVSATFVDESSRDGSTWHWVFTPFLVLTIVFFIKCIFSLFSSFISRGGIHEEFVEWETPGLSWFLTILHNNEKPGPYRVMSLHKLSSNSSSVSAAFIIYAHQGHYRSANSSMCCSVIYSEPRLFQYLPLSSTLLYYSAIHKHLSAFISRVINLHIFLYASLLVFISFAQYQGIWSQSWDFYFSPLFLLFGITPSCPPSHLHS